MKDSIVVAVAIVMLGAAAPSVSQQPPSTPASSTAAASSTPASTAPTAAEKPTGLSAHTLEKAKSFGLHAETRKGATVYCRDDESTGTRFKTKKCYDETDLEVFINGRKAMKDQMKSGMGTSNK